MFIVVAHRFHSLPVPSYSRCSALFLGQEARSIGGEDDFVLAGKSNALGEKKGSVAPVVPESCRVSPELMSRS